MRKKIVQQLALGQKPIEQTHINPKSTNAVDELLAALKAIYCNKEYNEKYLSKSHALLEKLEKELTVFPQDDMAFSFTISQSNS